MVRDLLCNAEDMILIPDGRAQIPHGFSKPECYKKDPAQPKQKQNEAKPPNQPNTHRDGQTKDGKKVRKLISQEVILR